MGRQKRLAHVQSRVEEDLYELLLQYAETNRMNVAEAVRACIEAHLTEKTDLRERGYKDAKLRALHEARGAVQGALDGLFK